MINWLFYLHSAKVTSAPADTPSRPILRRRTKPISPIDSTLSYPSLSASDTGLLSASPPPRSNPNLRRRLPQHVNLNPDKENQHPSTDSMTSVGTKRSHDTEVGGEVESPSKRKKPTASGLPFRRRLIVDAGKEHFCVQMITVAAWLAGQALDGALIMAWTKGYEEMKANGIDLEEGLQASEAELNLVTFYL